MKKVSNSKSLANQTSYDTDCTTLILLRNNLYETTYVNTRKIHMTIIKIVFILMIQDDVKLSPWIKGGLLIPRSSLRFRPKLTKPENSNLHGYELHSEKKGEKGNFFPVYLGLVFVFICLSFPFHSLPVFLFPRSSVRFRQKLKNPENSNLHGFELHIPSSKGINLLLQVIIHQSFPFFTCLFCNLCCFLSKLPIFFLV